MTDPEGLRKLIDWLNRQRPDVIAGDAWLAARYPEIIDEFTRLAFAEKT